MEEVKPKLNKKISAEKKEDIINTLQSALKTLPKKSTTRLSDTSKVSQNS